MRLELRGIAPELCSVRRHDHQPAVDADAFRELRRDAERRRQLAGEEVEDAERREHDEGEEQRAVEVVGQPVLAAGAEAAGHDRREVVGERDDHHDLRRVVEDAREAERRLQRRRVLRVARHHHREERRHAPLQN